MRKAVFLDRDGTINAEKHYLYKKEDFELLPGAAEGMKLLRSAGYRLIIITNQSGIGRGYYTEEEFTVLTDWMTRELEKLGAKVDGVYYCPHHPEAKLEKYRKVCTCRKPADGLFKRAARDFDIDLDQSRAIGDKLRDCGICESTGCRGYLIGDNEENEIISRVKAGEYRNTEYAESLLEAAKRIVKENKE